jgi:hypothetical protein
MMTPSQTNALVVRLIVAGGLAFAFACWLSAVGCASPRPDRLYQVQSPVTIVVTERERIGRMCGRDTIVGTSFPDVRWIVVPWDGQHPDFYVLGHELWHLPELGGDYHP